MQRILIEPMKKDDLGSILAIERRVFPDPWSYKMFAEQIDLAQIYSLVVARLDNEITGYSGLLNIGDEGHITNLAVKPEKQSKGIGKSLVYFVLDLARKSGVESISLEVRTTNKKAQKLYSSFGFEAVNVRKNYYSYEDDALVMSVKDIRSLDFCKKLDKVRECLNYRLEDFANVAS